MQPIKLSESQMAAALAASAPLPANRRAVFLAEVASALTQLPEVGDGALHRVIMEVQKRHFDPPLVGRIRTQRRAVGCIGKRNKRTLTGPRA